MEDYEESIRRAGLMLAGELAPTRRWLQQQMTQQAEVMNFEQAERYRIRR